MTPIHHDWSVTSWERPEDDDNPEPPMPRRGDLSAMLAELDSNPEATSATVDAALLRSLLHHALREYPTVPGAEIHDHYRNTTYRATIDQRGKLDHLETVSRGVGIDENALRRVPVERIRRAVFEQVQAQHGAEAGTLMFTPPGGVRFTDGEGPPDAEELARLMKDRGMHRQELARHYGTAVKNVDRWVRNARRQQPDLPWPTQGQGRRTDLGKSTGESMSPDQKKRTEKENKK